jgi:2,3-bisphosphoglycerate-dependent phosphoglycerate mutase
MTTVYFIRHAEPNRTSVNNNEFVDAVYPLTDKGLADCALVTYFLRDKNINAVLSSPYKRSYDTVAHYAKEAGLEIEIIDDFRERRVTFDHIWVEDFKGYSGKQWADFSYKLEDGESLHEVQTRNITALRGVLTRYARKNIAVGTHGTALSTIIRFYDPSYGINDFLDMAGRMPWAVKMAFDGERCVEIEKIDLFKHDGLLVTTFPYNSFNQYTYTVIIARQAIEGKWKYLFCRHKDRTTYEFPGGRIEPDETPLECAKRELREETGATKFHIYPAFDYTVHRQGVYSPGQVFLADIIFDDNEKTGLTHEIIEVRVFDTLPENMTYPQIQPILFAKLQEWLAKSIPDEYRDLLDANRNLLGIKHKRGEPQPPDTYVAVVRAWVMNAKGEILITRRALSKFGSPGMWEIPSGSVEAGEDSLTAAVRELKEESGITVPPESGELFYTVRDDGAFWDNWLFRCEFDLADVVLLEGETMDARAATINDIDEMAKNGLFIKFVDEELKILRNVN